MLNLAEFPEIAKNLIIESCLKALPNVMCN